jgi:Stress responsive A/B Barrel Domain
VTAVRHVATFTFVEGVTEEQIANVTAGLAALPDTIPEIDGFTFGPDIGLNDGNAHYSVVADFASIDAYLAYRDHPAHEAVLADRIRPILVTRAAVQFFS